MNVPLGNEMGEKEALDSFSMVGTPNPVPVTALFDLPYQHIGEVISR